MFIWPTKSPCILVFSFLSLSAQAADAQLLGSWHLVSYFKEKVETQERTQPWGERPTGTITYLPNGRMFAVITAEGRKTVTRSDKDYYEQSGHLLFSMSAYTGTYTVDANKVVHRVDAAWLPSWVGSEQPRWFQIDGDSLKIRTQPIQSPPDWKEYVYILEFKRAE